MGLLKSLNLADLTFIGLGDIFGAGIFVLISQCIRYAGKHIYWVFLLITILSIISGLCYAEISTIYPDNTAEQQAIHEGLHPYLGQIMNFLIYFYGVATTSTILVSIGKYLQNSYDINKQDINNPILSNILKNTTSVKSTVFKSFNFIVSTILLLLMTIWNLSGINVSKKIIQYVMISLLSILFILFIGGFSSNPPKNFSSTYPPSSNFVLSSILFIFLYNGYDSIVKMKEEVLPNVQISNAIIYSIGISAILYFICIYLGKQWLSYNEVKKSITFLPSIFHKIFGNHFYWYLLLFGIIVMLNTAFISYLAATRYMYGIAHDHYNLEEENKKIEEEKKKNMKEEIEQIEQIEKKKQLTWKQRISKWIQELNSNQVPWKTILFTSFIVLLLNIKRNEVFLALFTDISVILILLLISLSVIFLRIRKNTIHRSYKVPLNIPISNYSIPILPIISVFVYLYLLYYAFVNRLWKHL
jgi:APA family basic amino acid/polyamine antiporter